MQSDLQKPLISGDEELKELLRLAASIEAFLPDGANCLEDWRATLETACSGIDVNSLAGEQALDELGLALRNAWLQLAHERSHGYLMAPPHAQEKFLPSGEKFQFDYERSSRPESLERRGWVESPEITGWDRKCMLFSSGMSAIATVVQVCCARLDGPMPETAVNLDMFGGYFETWRLLDAAHDAVLKVSYLQTNQQIVERVVDGATDILVIEPVAYDWDMTVFDVEGFGDAWRRAGEKHPRVLIIDTSLTAHTLDLTDLMPAFGETLPWLVVFVRSGLKLDQQGLELSNVGVVDLYVPDGEASPVDFDRLKQRLSVNRAITGAGLTINQTAALEAPWFLDRPSLAHYADRIFANNRRLAEAVRLGGGIFSRVNHPFLGNSPAGRWGVSPFVVFHLNEDSQTRHGLLVAILVHESRRRGLVFELGSSFGFRGHRFEVIRPLVQIRALEARTGLLKIAMGYRQGPSLEGIIDLVNELAAYPGWQALIDAYPEVKPYVKGSFGVYMEKPPRR